MKAFSNTARCVFVLLLTLFSAVSTRAETGDFLLIQKPLLIERIRLVEINDEQLIHLEGDLWISVNLDDCIALIDTESPVKISTQGVLVLADGQVFPGRPFVERGRSDDIFSWDHKWLGPLDVPLEAIATVIFRPGEIAPVPENADALLLINGDRFDGLLLSLDDPVQIELEREGELEILSIPRSSVAAVSLMTTRKDTASRRVWFDDHTVMDVNTIQVGDDGFVRFTSRWHSAGTKPAVVKLGMLRALLLDSQSLLPLALIDPDRIEGPDTRFVLPSPRTIQPDAALGLSGIEYRGPLVVRYLLPAGCRRFAARAELPRSSQDWGDCELVIRSNDEEVFRQRLNADNPEVQINVILSGSELTIELTEGANGPIQDLVILHQPMLLLEGE